VCISSAFILCNFILGKWVIIATANFIATFFENMLTNEYLLSLILFVECHGVHLFFSFSPIPSKGVIEEKINLYTRNEFCDGEINFLEHIEVAVNLNYTRRGDLLIKLISPHETVSNLTYYRMYDSALGAKDLNWVLMTLHHWGESAMGTWKLTLENSQLRNVNTG